MIDLHCHSHFSDGQFSPEVLIQKAISAGVRILALTDHDTVAGLQALHHAAFGHDIHIINGIELSVRWKKHDIHILGLRIDPQHTRLQSIIAEQNERRITRARLIAEQVQKILNIENAYEKACDIAGHRRVARPHFAQLLINEGVVDDMAKAFKRYLKKGRSAYVPTEWITMEQAVTVIAEVGGSAVIAHPLKYKLTRTKLYELLTAFKTFGGTGIEVVSGWNTVIEQRELAGLCQRYELLASSGSDFHGDMSQISLGKQAKLPINCTPIWETWAL